jgi:hypothetical protein
MRGQICLPTEDFLCQAAPGPPSIPHRCDGQPFCIGALHAIAQGDVAFQNGAPCICQNFLAATPPTTP